MKAEMKKGESPRLAFSLFCRTSVLHGTDQIILHHINFHSSAAAVLRHGSISAGNGRISHAQHVNAVDRDRMVEHQVTHHRIRHLLRAGNPSLAATRSEPANFEDVAALILQWSGHLVERILRRLAQDALTCTESNF